MSTVARSVRPQVGLMLSCGEAPTAGRNHPRKLDYIRAKRGSMGQFGEYAEKFEAIYGTEPRDVDVIFVEDAIGSVLDVRPKVWGASRLKAVGNDNLAELDPQAFANAVQAYDWDLTTFPDDSPEPGTYKVNGRDDKAVTKLKLKLYGTLRVALPRVTGLMLVTEITTTSLRTMANWHNGLSMASKLTGGVLVGIPFRLMLRPARTSFFDPEKRRRMPTEFFEWVLESSDNLERLYEIATERRQMLASGGEMLALPPIRHDDAERDREVTEALWGPPGHRAVQDAVGHLPDSPQDTMIREEAQASLSDALQNRIARLETEVGAAAAQTVLRGVFGKDHVIELTPEEAERYADMLEKSTDPGLGVEEVEAELVEESTEEPSGESQPADAVGDVTVDEEAEFSSVEDAAEPEALSTATPSAPAADPEPVKLNAAGLMEPVDVAGDLEIPIGGNRGTKIVDLDDDEWFAWALRNPGRFPGHDAFYAGLELWVRTKMPDLWTELRG